jgi:aspartate kinase
VDVLKQEHINAAQASIRDPEILLELQEEIDRDYERLRTYLFAAKVCSVHPIECCSYLTTVTYAQTIDEVSPRSKDNISGRGEQMACKFMTTVLRDQVSFFFLLWLYSHIDLTGNRR